MVIVMSRADDRQRVAELAVEDLGEVARALDEHVVAVARGGEALHQVLVVLEAEADGGDGDALRGELAAELGELARRRRPDVGEAVRQQDDAVDLGVGQELLDLAAAFLDAVVERGRAVGGQAVDGALRAVVRAAEAPGRAQHIDVVVVGDEGDDVVGGQALERDARAFLRRRDAVALHGAGAVDDDRGVDAACGARASRRRGS